MAKNRPRRVLVELTPAPDPEARLEVLEALLAGGGLPFSRRGETPVAGHKAVGEDGDEPLPGGVDDAAAHHPGGVAAQAHAHGQGLLAAGAGLLEGVVQHEGHPGEVAQILQQGEQGEEDGHGGQHDGHHPGQHPVHPVHQGAEEPGGGVEPG